jgi:hypothetical protein
MGSSREHGLAWRTAHLLPFALTLVPLPPVSALAFVYAGLRGRRPRWLAVGAGYILGFMLLMGLTAIVPLCVTLWLGSWIGGMVYAYRIRGEFLDRAQRVSEAFGDRTIWMAWSPPVESAPVPSRYPVVQAPDGEDERRRQERIAALRVRADAAADALRDGRVAPDGTPAPRTLRRRCTYCGGLVDEQDRDCRGCGAPA